MLRIFTLLLLLLSSPAYAHDGIHERIEQATRAIAENPKDAELYVRRAALHRAHRDDKACRRDLEAARQLDPECRGLDLEYGRFWSAKKDWVRAEAALDRSLKHFPDGPLASSARRMRGRARASRSRHSEAVSDFEWVLANASEPSPDDYLERSRSLASCGRTEEAIAGLDEGIAKLGAVPALVVAAIDLAIRGGKLEAALERVEQALLGAKRKETWHSKRGDILLLAGREDAAREAYRSALKSWRELSPKRRRTKAMTELLEHVRERLRQLEPQKTP